MSNPYSSQTIANYNASPPPDDGTTVDANQITWAKHKTKLADPIKTLAEGIDSAVSTAFGKLFLNDAVSKSTAYTVTASDQGKLINVTNTTTITLPASGSVGPNFAFAIRNNGTGTVTVDGNSSETINGAVTQTIAPGYGMTLMSDANGWFAFSAMSEADAEATAITNYTSGIRTYIFDDLAAAGANFSVDTSIAQLTWESVGPTGSGATNETALLDDIPDNAKAVILVFQSTHTPTGSGACNVFVHARQTGSSQATAINKAIIGHQWHTTNTSSWAFVDRDIIVPIDSSKRFDLQWTVFGQSAITIAMSLRGFIK